MSNKLTRKGLAFGALVALTSTLFAGAPAQAVNVANVQLAPTAGTTYNSILQSGMSLKANLNNLDADTVEDAEYLVFRIENPGERDITVDFDGRDDDNSGVGADEQITVVRSTAATLASPIAGSGDNFAQRFITGGEDEAFATDIATTAGDQIRDAAQVDDKFIYVSGFSWDGTSEDSSIADVANQAVAGAVNELTITTSETTRSVSLKVQAWLDINGNGVIDTFEERSAVVDVVLYAPGTYSAVTTMYETTRAATDLKARVAYNNSINPNFVAGDTTVEFFKDGTGIAEDSSGEVDASGRLFFDNAAFGDLTDSVDGSGQYHARAVYTAAEDDYYVGSRSVILDLRNGSNSDVDGVEMQVADDANVAFDEEDSDEVAVRTGTKSVTITAQALDDEDDALSASNIQVRAVVTGIALGATSSVTVTGATGTITEEDDVIVATGFTNSSGQVSFVINNTVGAKDDEVSISLSAKDSDGIFEEMDQSSGTVEIVWQNSALTSFEASAEVISGATPSIEFSATDQWGEGLDSSATLGRYSVHVQAYVAGVVRSTVYSETKTTTNGDAAFSFTNFVAVGDNEQIVATLYNGTEDVTGLDNPIYVDVYNNLATAAITLNDDYETLVSYVDYVVGDLDTASVAKSATDKGVLGVIDDTDSQITGTVLNANNQGQPGAVVTVAIPGALLWDPVSNVLAQDSVTTVANDLGFFTVGAMVQRLNTKGAVITVTSDGKSATSLLKSYFGDSDGNGDLDRQSFDDGTNVKFSLNLPANMVKNVTYSVTATLTDVWGNPIQTVYSEDEYEDSGDRVPAVTIEASGSLTVNGVQSITRNANSSGEITFFLRSVTDVAGPANVTLSLPDELVYRTGDGSAVAEMEDLDSPLEDNVNTSWDESLWSNTISVDLDVLDAAPAQTGKVNVGSFNGKLVVYAAGLDGAKISWKVAGKWGVANAVGNNLNRFDRPVGASGVNVIVEIYVNGVKQLTKTVLTR
jgi:trimeric autotransporter adhesin